MKFFAAVVATLALFMACEAYKPDLFPRFSTLFDGIKAHPKFPVFLAEPQSSCEQDIAELQSQKFMTCDEISQEIVTREAVNVTAVNAYCRLRCSDYLVDLYRRLVADCGVDPGPDNEPALHLLDQFCDHGPAGVYCAILWGQFAMKPLSYDDCVIDFNPSGGCPDDCKTAEDWVVEHWGCCYKAEMDYFISQSDGALYFLDDRFWNPCGKKEPVLCTNCTRAMAVWMFAVLFLAVSQGGSSLLPAVDPATALSELRADVAAYVEMGAKQAYRVKRQSATCFSDLQTIRSDDEFLYCNNILQVIYAEGNTAVNRSAVADFCQEHCSEYLQYWFHKLARDCGNPIGNDVAVRLLNQTCYKGPHNLYCAFLWGYFRDTTLLPSSIQQCATDMINGGGSCPDSCKQGEQWIIDNEGCCFRALVSYEADYDDYIGGGLDWDACGKKEPDFCV